MRSIRTFALAATLGVALAPHARAQQAQTTSDCPSRTGSSHTLVIPADAASALAPGTRLRAMAGEQCAGETILQDAGASFITVWGDDEQTDARDGATAGHVLDFVARAPGGAFEPVEVAVENGEPTFRPGAVESVLGMGAVATGADDAPEAPAAFTLSDAYPNPFNPQTRIELQVGTEQHVRVHAYDVAGRRVATLHDGTMQPGTAHALTFEAGHLASGLYLIRAEGETFRAVRSVTLLK